MSQELPHIIPSPQPEVEEMFLTHEVSIQFYDEVELRSQLKAYSEWYYTTAEHHRQELEKMRGELNIFAWFRRKG
ncbi:MAG: hypothetical protein QNJ47_15885 [Nostocaceae cyanobacterium]|nr:hypothetical protein [Nostocaceae cyanobacterium]